MHISIKRNPVKGKPTTGVVKINGQFECFSLEDEDRGLDASMSLIRIKSVKIWGKTCVPYGTYKVVKRMSPKFGKEMFYIENVPGYSGTMFHGGLTEEHTLGCPLLGKQLSGFTITPGTSKPAVDAFYQKLDVAWNKGEEITVTFEK